MPYWKRQLLKCESSRNGLRDVPCLIVFAKRFLQAVVRVRAGAVNEEPVFWCVRAGFSSGGNTPEFNFPVWEAYRGQHVPIGGPGVDSHVIPIPERRSEMEVSECRDVPGTAVLPSVRYRAGFFEIRLGAVLYPVVAFSVSGFPDGGIAEVFRHVHRGMRKENVSCSGRESCHARNFREISLHKTLSERKQSLKNGAWSNFSTPGGISRSHRA